MEEVTEPIVPEEAGDFRASVLRVLNSVEVGAALLVEMVEDDGFPVARNRLHFSLAADAEAGLGKESGEW